MMLSISVKMTGIAILIVPISLLLIMVVVKNSQKYFKTQQEYLGVINGKDEETIGGYTIVRLFNEEENSLKEFKEQNDILFKSAWKSQFLSGLMQPIMNFVGNLGYVGVAIAGGVMAYNGTITVGDIQAFIQYVRNLTQPIAQLAQVSNMLQSMAAAAERVFEFLAEDEEEQWLKILFKLIRQKEWSISIMFNLAIHLIKSLFKTLLRMLNLVRQLRLLVQLVQVKPRWLNY